MVACADRYLCAVALLAVWQTGRLAALPPNSRPETIDRLCAERGISLILHDGGGQGEHGLDVRTRLSRRRAPRGARRRPRPRVLARPRAGLRLHLRDRRARTSPVGRPPRQLLGEAALLVRLWDLGPATRVLASVPPHHLYGLLFGVLVPFMGGGSFVRTTPLHAETIAAQARTWQVDTLVSVPAHLHALATLPRGRAAAAGAHLLVGRAARPATASAVTALAGIPVTEVLGSSETGGIAWRESGGDATWAPFPGVASRRTTTARCCCAPRSSDDATARRAGIAAPTGSASRDDGRFELLGRADGVVKIGGSRVAVAEIERLLRETPGVADAAVVSVDTPPPRRHELWAAVVAPTLSVAALRAALLRRVEPIALPRRFRLVAALPREDNGKLVRARLLALFATEPANGRRRGAADDRADDPRRLALLPRPLRRLPDPRGRGPAERDRHARRCAPAGPSTASCAG